MKGSPPSSDRRAAPTPTAKSAVGRARPRQSAYFADPVGPRLTLLGISDATPGGQSEEHLVVEGPGTDGLFPGSALLAIPTHICPTCALHSWAYVLEGGEVVDRWEVKARDRVLAF